MQEQRDSAGSDAFGAGPASAVSICEKVATFAGESGDVVLIGPSASHLGRALESKRRHVVDCAADDVPDLDRRFDVAVVEDALESVENLEHFLRSVRATLRPGGSLIVATANAGHAAYRLAMLARGPSALASGERRRRQFDLALLERALGRAAFEVAAVERVVAPLFVPTGDLPELDTGVYPEDVVQRLLREVDSETAAFVVRAVPLGVPTVAPVEPGRPPAAVRVAEAAAPSLQSEVEQYRRIVRLLYEKLAALEADQEAQVRELVELRVQADRARELAAELARLEAEVLDRNRRIAADLAADLARLQDAIDRIYASRIWRLKRALNRIVALVPRRSRR